MTEIIKIFAFLFLGQMMFLSGVFFTSGHLFSDKLVGFYEKTTEFIRLVIALFSFFALGNYIISKMYLFFDPAMVTLINIFCAVIVSIIMTVIIFQFKPSLMIIPAVLIVAFGCVWVNYLLQPQQ